MRATHATHQSSALVRERASLRLFRLSMLVCLQDASSFLLQRGPKRVFGLTCVASRIRSRRALSLLAARTTSRATSSNYTLLH